jgi:hypothetical protein
MLHLGCPLLLPVGTVNCVQTLKVIEDIAASKFRDLIYMTPGGGQNHLRRIHGWGFGRFITVSIAEDVNSFDTLRYIINAGYGALPSLATNSLDTLRHIVNAGTVRVLRQKFTLEDAIEFHAFAPLAALLCVCPMSFLSGFYSPYQLTL